jgi:hypothetical protein
MKNRTDSQIEASRANGAKSHGPVTAEGKAVSSQNATKLGLYSKRIVLASENQADYDQLLGSFITRFRPIDDVELEFVQGMVNARWQIRRIENVMTTALDMEVDRSIPALKEDLVNPDVDAFQLRAHEILTDNGQLEKWGRMQARLERQFDRHLRNLTKLQKDRPESPAALEPKPAPAPAKKPEIKNERNEPELISINEAIRRGLIPSLNPNSVPPAPTTAETTESEPENDLAA